jgi:UDP-N-acetylmuramate: L-alanyl-gamma-D-glutamyl-meso-diaminopimelate ligase
MRRVHLIGVCGTAMATLAALLTQRGFAVSGSDTNVYPPMSDFLAAEGIVPLQGYDAAHITSDIDTVIVGNAISRGNPEVEEVLDRKIRFCSLPEAVRDHFLWGARSIVIAGTHGKTTTSSLVAWVLVHGGLDPSALIGGIAANLGSSYRLGAGRDFVIEGDEYDSAFFDKTAKFLKYLPDVAVVANVEFDHADIYASLDEVVLAFRRFVNLVPRRGLLLLGADSPHALALREVARSPVETFGLADGADWQALDLAVSERGTRFRVRRSGRLMGAFELPLLGAHNVRNALVAIAVGQHGGLSEGVIAEGLRLFRGVKRRLELRGEARGVRVYDDFAHHPTAIAETIGALRLAHPQARIWAIFEPRSATSCLRIFQQDFVEALRLADEAVVAAVFRSSLPEDRRLSPEGLVAELTAQGARARYVPTVPEIVRVVSREAGAGDLVVVMSNGGFDGVHEKLLAALGGGAPADAPAGR